jgi:hypothetical protein
MEELARHNEFFDQELTKMNVDFEKANAKLEITISNIEEQKLQIENKIPMEPKPSIELIKLRKTMEELSKQREYAIVYNNI